MAKHQPAAPSTPIMTDSDDGSHDVVSELPRGVQMHNAGVSPYATKPIVHDPDPSRPPPGWVGSYVRCGGCGDFLGNAQVCRKCAPHDGPSNVQMSTPSRMMAR